MKRRRRGCRRKRRSRQKGGNALISDLNPWVGTARLLSGKNIYANRLMRYLGRKAGAKIGQTITNYLNK